MGSAAPIQNKTLNKLELAEHLCLAIHSSWPDLSVEIIQQEQPETVCIVMETSDANQFQCSLEHIYANYLKNQFQLERLCEHFIDALHEILEPDPDAPTFLIPIIQNQKWLDNIEKDRHGGDAQTHSPTASMPLTADLCIVFILRRNQTCLLATEDLLAEFVEAQLPHLAILEAMQVGTETLREQLPNIQIEHSEAGYRVRLDNLFDSSLVMMYEDWKDLLEIKGDPVFALIARDHFMLADSEKPEQVEHLKMLAFSAFKASAYPLSADLFTFKDNELVLYSNSLH
ncbi:MAG: hypothetical protein ACRCWR_07920 [Saezia sp.]